MKELELEAKDWIKNTSQHKSIKNGFIAGATSKYVEKQKLEFAIEQLREFEVISWNVTEKIEKLEKQLNELNV